MSASALPLPNRRRTGKAPSMLCLVVLASCCSGSQGLVLGEPVQPDAAVPLARLLAGSPAAGTKVIVSGRIGEVCRQSGCWFVLEDVSGERSHALLVDLVPAASFTLGRELSGSDAVVSGRLHGEGPDRTLRAVGMRVLP